MGEVGGGSVSWCEGEGADHNTWTAMVPDPGDQKVDVGFRGVAGGNPKSESVKTLHPAP